MSNWRRSKLYRRWRVAVIRRDKCCQICGEHKNRHAHHMEDASHHKETRFVVDFGITLCRKCHTMFHTDFKRSYRCKCTVADYENFYKLAKHYIQKGKEADGENFYKLAAHYQQKGKEASESTKNN